jgi:hypothetical protein
MLADLAVDCVSLATGAVVGAGAFTVRLTAIRVSSRRGEPHAPGTIADPGVSDHIRLQHTEPNERRVRVEPTPDRAAGC